jgi:hypothetical protein
VAVFRAAFVICDHEAVVPSVTGFACANGTSRENSMMRSWRERMPFAF